VARDKRDLSHEFLFRDAVPESRVAGAKDSAQDTLARPWAAPADGSLTHPSAMNTGLLGQRYRF
jgi:hypothetical protein